MCPDEQLRPILPECSRLSDQFEVVANDLLNRFEEDIEYDKASLRLRLKTASLDPCTYYVITKSAPNTLPEDIDWTTIPPRAGKVIDWKDGGGFIIEYKIQGGVIVAKYDSYEKNKFVDEQSFAIQLSDVEFRKIIKDISGSVPVHREKNTDEHVVRNGRISSFIKNLLTRGRVLTPST